MKYSLSFHFEPTKHARVEYYDLFFVLCVYLLHLKNVLHCLNGCLVCNYVDIYGTKQKNPHIPSYMV